LEKILDGKLGPLTKTDRTVANALLQDLQQALREARRRGYRP
jgi:hypothetical protein